MQILGQKVPADVQKRDDNQISSLEEAGRQSSTPLGAATSGDLSRLNEAANAVPKPAVPQRRILLSEDSSVNRRVAAQILRNLGYQVNAVSNGCEALRAVQQADYDIILLDCETPEMDGYQAATAIRQLPGKAGKRVPIIGLTAGSTPADREKRRAAGMDDYIVKPVRPQTVASILARWDAAAQGTPAPPLAVDREVLASLAAIAGDENPTLVIEVIELFLGSTPSRIAELRQALKKKDAKVLREVAHDLKGSSGQLGAVRLAQTCASIETLARAGSLKGIKEVLDQLDLEFDRVRNDLYTSAREYHVEAPNPEPARAPSQCDLAMLRAALNGKALLVVHEDANLVSELEAIFQGVGCSIRSVRPEASPLSGDLLLWATKLDELARLREEGLRLPVIVLAKDPDAALLDCIRQLGADFALQPFQAADLQLRALLNTSGPLLNRTEVPAAISGLQEVLVAEDDVLIARFLLSNLEGAGFRTTLAGDGDAALEALDRQRFGAVILDVNMPKIDGFGVLSQLRLRPESRRTPVLMLSARSQEHDIIKAFDLGADDYVTKPFNPLELVTRVRRLTRRQ